MGNVQPFGSENREILQAIRNNGLRYVSSWLKAGQREWNVPGENTTSFFYSKEGFGDILEIPAVGAYDVHFVQPTKLLVFDEEEESFSVRGTKMNGYYIQLLEEALRRANEVEKTVFVPLVFHPHVVPYYDPKLQMHEEILKFCKQKDILVKTYGQIDAMLRLRH
ncbi:MAG: hypothetical protein ABSB00_02865 [Minisyncoccia bacterium]|jgi:hypothetical protein